MIVITSLNETARFVAPGDTFNLTIEDGMKCTVLIKEKITVYKEINYIASFRFALEDGSCPGFHLTGIFANKKELPKEIAEGVMFDDLTPAQKDKFVKSCGIKIKNLAE